MRKRIKPTPAPAPLPDLKLPREVLSLKARLFMSELEVLCYASDVKLAVVGNTLEIHDLQDGEKPLQFTIEDWTSSGPKEL